jgi:hypothetical protein
MLWFERHMNSSSHFVASVVFFIIILHGPNRKHDFQHHSYFCRPVFTNPLLINGLHYMVLLLRACMLLALPRNGRCLHSHRLATGLYATIFNGIYLRIVIIHIYIYIISICKYEFVHVNLFKTETHSALSYIYIYKYIHLKLKPSHTNWEKNLFKWI